MVTLLGSEASCGVLLPNLEVPTIVWGTNSGFWGNFFFLDLAPMSVCHFVEEEGNERKGN